MADNKDNLQLPQVEHSHTPDTRSIAHADSEDEYANDLTDDLENTLTILVAERNELLKKLTISEIFLNSSSTLH